MDTKICKRCNLEKQVEDFGNIKKSPDGKSPYCRKCNCEKSQISKMKNPIKTRAKHIRNHMKEKSSEVGFYFDPYFTSEKIQEMIEEKDYCPCSRKFDKGYTGDEKKNPAAPSFDRFDSKLGYTKENVIVVCARCNHLKNDATKEEIYKIAVFIKKYSPK